MIDSRDFIEQWIRGTKFIIKVFLITLILAVVVFIVVGSFLLIPESILGVLSIAALVIFGPWAMAEGMG